MNQPAWTPEERWRLIAEEVAPRLQELVVFARYRQRRHYVRVHAEHSRHQVAEGHREPEDFVHDAVVGVLVNDRLKLRSRKNAIPYLKRRLERDIRRHYRGRREFSGHDAVLALVAWVGIDPCGWAERAEIVNRVGKAIQCLPPKQRQICTLYCLQGMLMRSVADELNIKEKTAWEHLRQAKTRLRRALEHLW